ncbi:unnamed protein product [Darwinula stevensoni]|uniref:Kringle domain-containing protein n=1 Tax=Darwinula stevensoni TaxID=69355 RepID=A0A7R8XDL5_9CRUS|nr:unnamed protein product [Darwinula stevensoni]CAG0888819.1 unnamed protein product [Darwinula stevensoni]
MNTPVYRYPECRLTEKGREYIGKVSKTKSGKECLRWDIQPYGTPDDFLKEVMYSNHFSNLDTWSQKNYCRNPSGRERPWCFVRGDAKWEYCDIPMCTDTDPPECKITQKGGEYIGRKSVSHSGSACRPWGIPWRSTTSGMGTFLLPAFPDYKETAETHNFCRNPDGRVALWCFTENENRNVEFCDIPFCDIQEVQVGPKGNVYPECRLTEKGKEYFGTKDVTEMGKPCFNWESQPYGMPWDFFNQEMPYPDHFINVDPAIHKNYCRNPSLYREKPWCFVTDSDIEWEYCDIPICRDLGGSINSIMPPECKLTRSGGEYVGRRNSTISGFPCQHWLARFPNSEEFMKKSLSAFPDEVDGSHNFCRNPDNTSHGPWCWSWQSGKTLAWEYCNVPFCQQTRQRCDVLVSGNCITPLECKKNQKGDEYMGTKNITRSGQLCLPWMKRPNFVYISDFYLKVNSFPDDLHPSHNFCRNPNGDKNGHWCYYKHGINPVIDYCDIKDPPPIYFGALGNSTRNVPRPPFRQEVNSSLASEMTLQRKAFPLPEAKLRWCQLSRLTFNRVFAPLVNLHPP